MALNDIAIVADIIPLFYPLFAASALLCGLQFGRENNSINFLKALLFVGVALAIIMKHAPFGDMLSAVFNTPALTVVERYGGFSYTHTEHAAFCVLFIAMMFDDSNKAGDRDYNLIKWLLVLSAMYSLLIPLSKAGLILLAFPFMKDFWKFLIFIIPGSYFVLDNYSHIIQEQLPYIYYGFIAATEANISDGSIGPRYFDWLTAFDSLRSGTMNLLIGNGPLRYYDESYIEVTAANILYRFGFLGFVFHYAPIIFAAYIQHRLGRLAISFTLLGIIIVDGLANFSESIKLFPFIYFLLGISLTELYILNRSSQSSKILTG